VLDVTAKKSIHSETLVLQVVNISAEPVPTAINLNGFVGSQSSVKGWKLSGPIDSVNTAQQPNDLVPVRIGWSLQRSAHQTSYTFDPYSVTVLTFE
jgi:alpha-L-arabinofuranosidase